MLFPELKEDFISKELATRIESSTVAITTVNAYFNHAGKFEIMFGKDLSRFSHDEVIEMLKDVNSRSVQSLKNRVQVFKQYTDFSYGYFAREFNCDYMNSYMSLTGKDIGSCISAGSVSRQIMSREEIDTLQNKLPNAVDKAIVECLFIGLGGKLLDDLTGLKEEQLDEANKRITTDSGICYPLDDRQIDLLIAAFDETESSSLGDGRTVAVDGKGRIYKERPNVHKVATPERRFNWVKRKIMLWRDALDFDILTAKTINMSGLVFELKKATHNGAIPLRPYLRTEEGKQLALRHGYASSSYVEIIAEKVKDSLDDDIK